MGLERGFIRGSVAVAGIAGLLAACAPRPETRLGRLVGVERPDSVVVDGRSLKAGADRTFVVLRFEGKKELLYEGGDTPPYAIVDSQGREFYYLGSVPLSPVSGGGFSTKGMAGSLTAKMTGRDGHLVVSDGTITMAEPRAVLLYRVPRDASDLTLVDGTRRYPLD